jgi:hypothetical protein
MALKVVVIGGSGLIGDDWLSQNAEPVVAAAGESRSGT